MKNNAQFFSTPYVRLAIVLLVGTILTLATIYLACLESNFSVTLQPGMLIKSSYGEFTVEEIDLAPEPGDIPKQFDYEHFLFRQDELAKILKADTITVTYKETVSEHKASVRTVEDLPALFWTQIIVALGGIFISGWIWALKSKSLPTLLFFLSGFGMGLSAMSSAVYTTRLMALPIEFFKPLSLTNAWSALGFGVPMIALFLIYPREIRRWKELIIFEFLFFFTWGLACTNQWWGFKVADVSVIILVMMIMICMTIAVQFVVTKNDPKSRAILLWLGLSVITGAGLFVVFNTLPVLLGLKPLEQGYAFLSFLIIYVGIAFGLKQYRLFEVGDWAYRFLFYTSGTLIFVAFDAVLVFIIGINRVPALGLALVAVSFTYLPLRDYFWRSFNHRKELLPHELLREALSVTLAPSSAVRLQRWEGLVKKLFDPLEMKYCEPISKTVVLAPDGVALTFPAISDIPALRIAYPWSGRSLFSLRTVDVAKQIVQFIEEAESSRQAYDRGVVEERLRIAQDLHDDVSARLLTGLHGENSDLRSAIQGAMTDIRSIVKGIAAEKVFLNDLLADLRSESHRRLQAVGMDLVWSLPEKNTYEFAIDYHLQKTLGSVIREIVSNCIKHSNAKKLEVNINVTTEKIYITATDNGQGFSEKVFQGHTGFGLKSLNKRVTDLGGTFEIKNTPHASVIIVLPLL
ncbi:ATP-binding protein [Pseudobdellovibrio sp. HCB154]|uniref:sensor histidine kinase n=1 Tax=Pseudobdellovibrio sp. HCB154 TaxID=3386277 RepID=UPI003916FE58